VEQLLTTKLYIPPPRVELVTRLRLVERLNKGLHGKLTLVSAPAGFGKTTLVSEWVEHLQQDDPKESQSKNKIAWLSLDENENELSRFLAYLVAALNKAAGNEDSFGIGALGMLQLPQLPSTESILTALINEIAQIPDNVILILDDYHTIESEPINVAFAFLIEHLPPNLCLVIVTRTDPPLPLARLRARGQLNELRAADLRFSPSEATKFLNQVMDLDLSAEDITALDSRTEGWIVGLQLLAVSLQGREDPSSLIQSFSGSHHFVLDYLIEEVFEKQPEHIQAFLMKTAILDQLTGPLCDALTGRQDSQEILEELEHDNLFIVPIDVERNWYRYHRLFSDLLRQRLHKTQREQAAELHLLASKWHEKEKYFDKAIEHALHAGEFGRAADLIDKNVEAIWQSREFTNMKNWLSELPNDLLTSKPQLCILYAWDQFASGKLVIADRYLQAAEKALDVDNGQSLDPVQTRLRGRMFAIRGFMAAYLGDVKGIIQSAHQALEHLPEDELTWRSLAVIALGDAYVLTRGLSEVIEARKNAMDLSKASGNIYLFITASLKLASSLRQQGHLQQVIDICRSLAQHADEHGMYQTYIIGWLLAIWGETLAEINDLDEAVAKTKDVSTLIEQAADVGMMGWSHLSLIRIYFSRWDLDKAREIIHKIRGDLTEHDMFPMVAHHTAYWQVRVWLAQGKLEKAAQWVEERNLSADPASKRLISIDYLALVRILIAQGRLDEAQKLLDPIIEITEQRGYSTRLIEILILKALAFDAHGETSEAMEALKQALTTAEPGGFIRIFVDEGPPMARLLYEAMSRGISPGYAGRLLAAFPDTKPEQITSPKRPALEFELIEPLSEREIEVLHLISEGMTNKEIASKLFLSLNTIKVHTRNINSKLGTHNRTESVARARLLGLLSDD
jgi:LuxR family maltose regulon positive regulatory protein